MIWSYFPVGLSFPVPDFSNKTKTACWTIAFSVIAAGNRALIDLYESCTEAVAGGAQKEYVCILNHHKVTQSRENSVLWEKMDRMYANLSLHKPIYQANALDGFGPYTLLGSFDENGMLSRTETGEPFIPEKLPAPMPTTDGRTVLIAAEAVSDPLGFAAQLITPAAKAAAESGWHVDCCPMANGGIGTTFALTYARRGRFEWISSKNTSDERVPMLIGVFPPFTVGFDCASVMTEDAPRSSEALGLAIRKILDLGYRKMVLAIDGYSDDDHGEGFGKVLSDPQNPDRMDARLSECSITLLGSGLEHETCAIQKLIELGAKQMDAADFLSEAQHLEERCRKADLVITGAKNSLRILSEVQEAAQSSTPVWQIPTDAVGDRASIFSYFQRKFLTK